MYTEDIMVKQKKKRTKKYSGSNAAMVRPAITRVSAVNRSKLGQYWYERKRVLKPVLIVAGIVAGVIVLVIEIIRIISGSAL